MDLIDANHRNFPTILRQIFSEQSFRGNEKDLYLFVFYRCNNCLLNRMALVGVYTSPWHKIWKFP